MLEYNPAVKNGKFEVRGGEFVKSYRALDRAEAKWKFQRRFPGVEVSDVLEIEPTIRQKQAGCKAAA